MPAPALTVLGIYFAATFLLGWFLPPRPRFAHKLEGQFGRASSDGRFVFSWSKDEGRWIYRALEAATGRECFRLVDEDIENPPLIDFGPGGHTLFCFSVDGRWMAVDPEAGRPLIDRWRPNELSFNMTPGGVFQATADGRSLVAFRARLRIEGKELLGISDPRVEIWDLGAGQLRAAIEGIDRAMAAEDGQTLIAAEPALPSLAIPIPGRGAILPAKVGLVGAAEGWDRACVIRRRDLRTGEALATIPGWIGHADALAVAPDGSEVAVGTSGIAPREGKPGRPIEVRRWELAGGRELAIIRPDPSEQSAKAGRDPAISRIQYLPTQGALQIFGEMQREQEQWDIAAEVPRPDRIPPGGGSHFYSRDGRWVVQEHGYSSANPRLMPGGISILDASTLREHFHIGPPGVHSLGFSPDGRLFLVRDPSTRNPLVATARRYFGSREEWAETIRAYDIETGRQVGVPASVPAKYGNSTIYPNHTLIFSGEGGYEIWEIPPRRPWGAIFGYAAIPAGIALAVGWRRRRALRARARDRDGSIAATGGPSLTEDGGRV